jgi:hypothetical protein
VRQNATESPDRVRCWAQAEPARTLATLQQIPVVVIQAEASYHATYDHCTVAYLKQARVARVDFIRLADAGIKGNGHMLMLERNNMAIAAVIEKWLRDSIEKGPRSTSSR